MRLYKTVEKIFQRIFVPRSLDAHGPSGRHAVGMLKVYLVLSYSSYSILPCSLLLSPCIADWNTRQGLKVVVVVGLNRLGS